MRDWVTKPVAATLAAAAIALGAGGIYAANQSDGGSEPPPEGSANIWVESGAGACAGGRSATPIDYESSVSPDRRCGSLDAAWDAMNSGDTARIKAGTYGPQAITGDKSSTTYLIGESKESVLFQGTSECVVVFGANSVICARGAYMHLENASLDSEDTYGHGSAARIWEFDEGGAVSAHHVTFKNVDMWGGYPNLYIEAADFTWDGGNRGHPDHPMPELDCQGGGQSIQIFSTAPRAVLDGVTHWPLNTAPAPTCDPHVESIRLNNVDDVVIRNNYFVAGSDVGSGHIFTNAGDPPTDIRVINSVFGQVNASFIMQITLGSGWVFAYNTFFQASSLAGAGLASSIWVGNLGVSHGCSGTHAVNMWTTTGSCGTDTFLGAASPAVDADGHLQAGSPAIDAGETPGASDYCTNPALVASEDRDGDTRPAGADCDAGSDEYTP